MAPWLGLIDVRFVVAPLILARIGIWCNGKHGVVFAQPGEVRIFGPIKLRRSSETDKFLFDVSADLMLHIYNKSSIYRRVNIFKKVFNNINK
jgi:hypothetical protein